MLTPTRASKSKSRYSIATSMIPASVACCVVCSPSRQSNATDCNVSCKFHQAHNCSAVKYLGLLAFLIGLSLPHARLLAQAAPTFDVQVLSFRLKILHRWSCAKALHKDKSPRQFQSTQVFASSESGSAKILPFAFAYLQRKNCHSAQLGFRST